MTSPKRRLTRSSQVSRKAKKESKRRRKQTQFRANLQSLEPRQMMDGVGFVSLSSEVRSAPDLQNTAAIVGPVSPGAAPEVNVHLLGSAQPKDSARPHSPTVFDVPAEGISDHHVLSNQPDPNTGATLLELGDLRGFGDSHRVPSIPSEPSTQVGTPRRVSPINIQDGVTEAVASPVRLQVPAESIAVPDNSLASVKRHTVDNLISDSTANEPDDPPADGASTDGGRDRSGTSQTPNDQPEADEDGRDNPPPTPGGDHKQELLASRQATSGPAEPDEIADQTAEELARQKREAKERSERELDELEQRIEDERKRIEQEQERRGTKEKGSGKDDQDQPGGAEQDTERERDRRKLTRRGRTIRRMEQLQRERDSLGAREDDIEREKSDLARDRDDAEVRRQDIKNRRQELKDERKRASSRRRAEINQELQELEEQEKELNKTERSLSDRQQDLEQTERELRRDNKTWTQQNERLENDIHRERSKDERKLKSKTERQEELRRKLDQIDRERLELEERKVDLSSREERRLKRLNRDSFKGRKQLRQRQQEIDELRSKIDARTGGTFDQWSRWSDQELQDRLDRLDKLQQNLQEVRDALDQGRPSTTELRAPDRQDDARQSVEEARQRLQDHHEDSLQRDEQLESERAAQQRRLDSLRQQQRTTDSRDRRRHASLKKEILEAERDLNQIDRDRRAERRNAERTRTRLQRELETQQRDASTPENKLRDDLEHLRNRINRALQYFEEQEKALKRKLASRVSAEDAVVATGEVSSMPSNASQAEQASHFSNVPAANLYGTTVASTITSSVHAGPMGPEFGAGDKSSGLTTPGNNDGQPNPVPTRNELTILLHEQLKEEASSIKGDRDSAGNFLNPQRGTVAQLGEFVASALGGPDFEVKPNDNSISETTVHGLILAQKAYIANLDAFANELTQLRDLPDDKKVMLARNLREASSEVWTAYYNMMWKRNTALAKSQTGFQDSRDEFNRLMLSASRAEKKGDYAAAEAIRAQAADTNWGTYLDSRRRYAELVDQNRLLGIKTGGFAGFGDRFLFERMQITLLGYSETEENQMLLDMLNRYLDAGIEQARTESAEARAIDDIDDLWQFGGGKYQRQREDVANLGKQLATTLPGLLMEQISAAHDAAEADNAFWNGLRDGSLSVVAAGSTLIPVAGPFISAGITLVEVGIAGSDVIVTYRDQLDAERSAAVTGHGYALQINEQLGQNTQKFLMSAVFGMAPDASDLAKHVQGSFQFRRVTKDALVVGRDGARSRLAGLPTADVEHWLSTVSQAGRDSLRNGELAELAELVREARDAGLPDDAIHSVLARARDAEKRLTRELIGSVERNLIIARAKHEGQTVFVDPEDAATFQRYFGEIELGDGQRVHTRLLVFANIKSKALLEKPEMPQLWYQEEVDFVRQSILPVDDEVLLNKWVEFEWTFGGWNIDGADGGGGLVPVFTQDVLDAIRKAFEDGGPALVAPTPPSTAATRVNQSLARMSDADTIQNTQSFGSAEAK